MIVCLATDCLVRLSARKCDQVPSKTISTLSSKNYQWQTVTPPVLLDHQVTGYQEARLVAVDVWKIILAWPEFTLDQELHGWKTTDLHIQPNLCHAKPRGWLRQREEAAAC